MGCEKAIRKLAQEGMMKQSKGNRILRLLAAGLITSSVLGFVFTNGAQAALVTFKFEGHVTTTSGDPNPLISRNTPISGFYSFQSDAPNISIFGDPNRGLYELTTFSLKFLGNTYSLGPDYFSGGTHSVSLHGPMPSDLNFYSIDVSHPLGGTINQQYLTFFSFSLAGHGLFTNSAPPLTPPSLGNIDVYNSFRIQLIKDSSNATYAEGNLASLTLSLTPVPLPGALLLFGSSLVGLVGLGLRRRLKSRV